MYLDESDLVSVIIPACNAEATLNETLHSVREQSYRNIEIIVVDDGSSDETRSIAMRHAEEDPRLRVVSIPNSGVAAARNEGFRLSRGSFVAPIDADDLWHPEKIKRQLAAFSRGGPRTGYVYTLFRRIDMQGHVISSSPFVSCEGAVFLRSLVTNFVGNGSALLIRRTTLEEIGGYDPELRRRGLEGTEDHLLQILIARRWLVGVVPSHLTGYRATPGAMSSDAVRMLESQLAVFNLVERRCPGTPTDTIKAARAIIEAKLAIVLARQKQLGAASAAACRSLLHSPPTGAVTLANGLVGLLKRLFRNTNEQLFPDTAWSPGPSFLSVDPDEGLRLMSWWPHGWLCSQLQRRETTFWESASKIERRSSAVSNPGDERSDCL